MTDRPQAYRAAEDFLEDHEDAESTLEAVLAADEGTDAWEFSDVELDSGTFGEVVSAGVVEKEDGAYHVPDRAAVEAALEGEEFETADKDSGVEFDFDVDYAKFGGLFGALLVVVAARTFHYRSVFVEGRVVSPGNDPYFFRYWQEQLIAQSSGPFDFSVLVNPPWDDGSFNQKPLTHATNWWFTELLGGDQWAADMVAAWLPVVFSLLLGVVIFYTAVILTRDARVGFVSVLVMALAPVHANYTGLGLLHHRYNQYLWFGLILLGLAWLGTDLKRRREGTGTDEALAAHLGSRTTWLVAAGLGLSLAAWTHSWGGSLELFVALGAYVGLRVCMDVREGVSPGRANLPLVAAFGLGGALAMALHLGLSWHGLPNPAVAALAAVGVVAVVALGEFWHRQEWSARRLLVVQPALGLAGLVTVLVAGGAFREVIDRVVTSIGPSSAPDWQVSTQSESLYSTDLFVVFGPLAQIGVEFYVGLAMLLWCGSLLYREYEPAWLAVAVVSVHYVVISGIQVRFAGRAVVAMAVLSGLGIVYLFSAVDLAQSPFPVGERPERSPHEKGPRSLLGSTRVSLDVKRTGMVLAVAVLVFGASLLFVPTLMSDVTHDPAHAETAMEISDHADSLDRDGSERHIFAPWSQYRMYNHFGGEGTPIEDYARYGYVPFVNSEDISESLDGRKDDIGYFVLTDSALNVSSDGASSSMSEYLGLPDDRFEGLEHGRLVMVDEESEIAVFAVVSGAEIELSDVSGENVTLETEVSVSGRTFTYSREVSVGEDGSVTATVPYAGEYEVGGETVSVSEEEVEKGDP